jgi:hypothetical protein
MNLLTDIAFRFSIFLLRSIMMKTMTEHKIQDLSVLKNENWEELCVCMAETFRFTEEEKETFSKDAVAKLIAVIPFEAGCDEPKRTALAHLAIYMTELRGGRKIGDHTPADNESPLTRLRLLSSFKGGKKEVIEHGMYQLADVMLYGYIRSKEFDKENNIYNPLNDGSWNADDMREEILKKMRQTPVKVLDATLPEIIGPFSAW